MWPMQFPDVRQQLQFRTLQLTRPLVAESLQLHAAAVHWLPLMKDYYERMAAEEREKAEAQLLKLDQHLQADSVSAERRAVLEAESSSVRLRLEQRDARLRRLMRLHSVALASIQQLQQAAAPFNELNDASASWCAFRRLCVLGAMAAALLDALDDHGLHEWGQLQQINSRLRKLMADIPRALHVMLPHVAGDQEQQQGLVRALLGIGEVGLAMKLTRRLQPTTGLNPPLGGELSALQRLAFYDSPLDHRLILMLLPHGLDPSDGRLAYPERRSAIDVAREVAASEEAAVVPQPHEHGAIGSRSPHSMLISRAELPLDEKPHQRIRLAHRMRVRFCVDLVRSWQLHSDSVREELQQHTPFSNLALTCIAEYLDLEAPPQQLQVEPKAEPQIEPEHANDDSTQRLGEAEFQGEPSTASGDEQHPQTALSTATEQVPASEPSQPHSASPSIQQQPSPEQLGESSDLHASAESNAQQPPVVLADSLHCVDAAELADLEQQLASLNAEVEAEERALAEADQQPSLQDVAALAELNAKPPSRVDQPSFSDEAAAHHESADSDPRLSGHDRPPPLSTSLLSDCRLHTVIEEGQNDESASISADDSSVEVSPSDGDGSAEAAAAVSEAEASDCDGAAWSDAAEADAESDTATPSPTESRVESDELELNDAVISEWLDSIDD